MSAPVATVTNVATGYPELNHAALALLTGYPFAEVAAWNSITVEAAKAGRRRANEAFAATGAELGMLDALTFYAIKEHASLELDGVLVVRNGELVAA